MLMVTTDAKRIATMAAKPLAFGFVDAHGDYRRKARCHHGRKAIGFAAMVKLVDTQH